MFLYLYMIVQTFLSFILVGAFYGAFSIFIRGVLESDVCMNVAKPANMIENIYLVFLVACLLLSTTVDVNWAEAGFRACSFGMGLFTLLMVVCTVIFAFQESLASMAVVFILIWIASYALPLLLNLRNLKACDFVKGIVYMIFLSPTYVNIFTIFAISNIHDVSWGSRPTSSEAAQKTAQDKKDEMYKDYRSNFLVFWLVCNIVTAYVITSFSRDGDELFIFYIGLFLAIVIAVKIVLSLLQIVQTFFHERKTAAHIKRRQGPKPKDDKNNLKTAIKNRVQRSGHTFKKFRKLTAAEKKKLEEAPLDPKQAAAGTNETQKSVSSIKDPMLKKVFTNIIQRNKTAKVTRDHKVILNGMDVTGLVRKVASIGIFKRFRDEMKEVEGEIDTEGLYSPLDSRKDEEEKQMNYFSSTNLRRPNSGGKKLGQMDNNIMNGNNMIQPEHHNNKRSSNIDPITSDSDEDDDSSEEEKDEFYNQDQKDTIESRNFNKKGTTKHHISTVSASKVIFHPQTESAMESARMSPKDSEEEAMHTESLGHAVSFPEETFKTARDQKRAHF